jgi:hypothetical protein
MPKVGIFSQRAKDRPNPIGITAVEIIKVSREYLEVKGCSMLLTARLVWTSSPICPQYGQGESPLFPMG